MEKNNFAYISIVIKVIFSRQFYFEISGIWLEGGNIKTLKIFKLYFVIHAFTVYISATLKKCIFKRNFQNFAGGTISPQKL